VANLCNTSGQVSFPSLRERGIENNQSKIKAGSIGVREFFLSANAREVCGAMKRLPR
jgi:hypothetical protein